MIDGQVASGAFVPEAPARFSWRRSLWPGAVAAVAVAGVAVVVSHNPYEGDTIASCPLFTTTGLLCPGCGGTRAVYSLAQGDIAQALTMHPLLTLAIPLVAVLWLRWTLRSQGVKLTPWPFPTWAGVAFGLGLLVFAVLRNIEPFAPFLGPGPGFS